MSGPDWDWQVVFDGGSSGNPGRGYGSFRLRPADGVWSTPERLEFGNRITNNEAEYASLIRALEALVRQVPDPKAVRVQVLGDSQLVINQVNGLWKVRAQHLLPFRDRVRALASEFGRIQFAWHRRNHSVDLLGH